jgi:general secretion pathway protein A
MTPRLAPEELLQAILDDLNIQLATTNKNEMIKVFRDFLINHSRSGKRVIIIVDEAQNLSDGSLEELRLLSNLETEKEKLLQIILVGQPELQKRLHSEGLRQLDQRISIRATLRPLTELETSDYISFRLIKAGKGSAIFDEKAKKLVHKLTGGIPRLINLTASRAMMVAYIGTNHHIQKKHIRETVKHIPDVQLKIVSRQNIFKYATVFALLVAAILILISGYHILPRRIASSRPPIVSNTQKDASITVSQTSDPKHDSLENHQRFAIVTARAARLREQPSVQSGIAATAFKGESFEITDERKSSSGNKWFKVRINDKGEYWVASQIVSVSSTH